MKRKENCVENLHDERQKKNFNIIKNFGPDPVKQRRCKKRNQNIYNNGLLFYILFFDTLAFKVENLF